MIVIYTMLMKTVMLIAGPVARLFGLFGKTYMLDRMRPPRIDTTGNSPRIWIHAASVGECGIAFSLAREFKSAIPKAGIYVSTITRTGLARIRTMNNGADDTPVDQAFLAPLDHPSIVRRYIGAVRPAAYILIETELWPVTVKAMHEEGVPISVVNGKLGKRAFRRYMGSMIREAMRGVAGCLSLVCVQNRTFAKRFEMLGVSWKHIEIIGNVKFDGLPEPDAYDRTTVRRELELPDDAPVIVAGSTRDGEESMLLDAFSHLLDELPDARLVLAPRHLKRVPEVVSTVTDAGYTCRVIGGEGTGGPSGEKVVVINEMGRLMRVFAAGDAAFVGGSLRDFGGHNPLEPAALGIPVVFGQFMEQTGSKELLAKHAAVLVHDTDELAQAFVEILTDTSVHGRMSAAGPAVVRRFRGTLGRTVAQIRKRGLV